MSNDPIAYERDGRVYYRASALGGCLVALAATRQGLGEKETPGHMQEIFDRGHETEDYWMGKYGEAHQVIDRQMEVVLPVTNKISVVGHIDGRKTHLVPGRVVEFKSQSDDEYDGYSPAHWENHPLWSKYAWQVSPYMIACNAELEIIRAKRSNPDDFVIDVIERPFHSLDEIRERVLEAEAMAYEDTLICRGPFSYPCPYLHIHQDGAEIVDDERLLQAVCDYKISNANIQAQQEIKARAREVIDEFLLKYVDQETGKSKILLPDGTSLSRSEYDRKEKIIPAGHETRVTVTSPKR